VTRTAKSASSDLATWKSGTLVAQTRRSPFDAVLASDPDVHFVWNHDTRYTGARTKNGTLHLSSDEKGLLIDAQVGNYSWAKDLRTGLERGDINQGSFAFTVPDGGDSYSTEDDGTVMRTISTVGDLFDVTVTAQGAYPQTSLAAMRSIAAVTGRPAEVQEAASVASEEEGLAEESQEGSVEADEDFARWQAALEKKMAARRATLANLQERMDTLHEREDA
jgi:HK97 family phage prohead protease